MGSMFKFLKSLKPAGKSKPPVARKISPSAKSKPMAATKPDSGSEPNKELLTAATDDSPSMLQLIQERPMTPEREKLIEKALSVHRAQQNVFSDLDESARQKLMLMSMLMLLKEARKPK